MLTIPCLSRTFEFYYNYVELSPHFYCTHNSRFMNFGSKFTYLILCHVQSYWKPIIRETNGDKCKIPDTSDLPKDNFLIQLFCVVVDHY